MRKAFVSLFLLVVNLVFADAATTHAQVRLSFGPRVGLNLTSAPFKDEYRTYKTKSRAGVEAGLLADIGFGQFAVQPALLYARIQD